MSFSTQTLGEIAAAIPASIKLFREQNLDFCCGGAQTLANAAAAKNLNLADIEARLAEIQHNHQQAADETGWNNAPYNQIIDHILVHFHQRHREQLQELIFLAQKIENVHSARPDVPAGIQAELQNVYTDLTNHMMKEEQILFPMINSGNYQMAHMPIQVMESEHDEHSKHIEILKMLTNNLTPPEDACNSWRTLYSGIGEFIDDLMMHIHTENNILFPRVLNEA